MNTEQLTPPEYVLYYLPNCQVYASLRQKLEFHPLKTVLQVNLLSLGGQRPPTLNGSPIIVETKLGTLYRGTDAIILLNKLLQLDTILVSKASQYPLNTLPGAGAGTGVGAGGPSPPQQYISPSGGLAPLSERQPTAVNDKIAFPDAPVSDRIPKQAGTISVEELQKRRESQRPPPRVPT